jgi:hypothetical protein
MPVPPAFTQAPVFLKVRSGRRGAPVAQEADRVLTLVTV